MIEAKRPRADNSKCAARRGFAMNEMVAPVFVAGLRTMTTAGDCETHAGMGAHVALVTASMERECLFNADGEFLIVAQQGALRFRTEFGVIDIAPGEVCVIPR